MNKNIVKLDKRDKKLIQLLDFNARQSASSLAKKLGISKQGAEYKLKNLQAKGVITGFYPVINVPQLGYLYCRLSIVLNNITDSEEKEFIAYLKKDPKVFWVFTTQGIYDYLLVIWAKSMSEYKTILDDILLKFGKFIKAKNETIATDVIHYQARYLVKAKTTQEMHLQDTEVEISLDNAEKQILSLLCENARMHLVTIAQKIGITAKTISRKIKNMEKKNIILGYRPIINHHRLGYTYYKLWISLSYSNPNKLNALYNYIKENPIVLYVVKGVGMPEDLDVEVMIKDNQELFNFIKDIRKKFPTLVGDYRSFMFIDTIKVRYLPF